MKQCKFYDKETDTVHNGILLNSDEIICACCGCTIEPGDYKLLKVYDTWGQLRRLYQRWRTILLGK